MTSVRLVVTGCGGTVTRDREERLLHDGEADRKVVRSEIAVTIAGPPKNSFFSCGPIAAAEYRTWLCRDCAGIGAAQSIGAARGMSSTRPHASYCRAAVRIASTNLASSSACDTRAGVIACWLVTAGCPGFRPGDDAVSQPARMAVISMIRCMPA